MVEKASAYKQPVRPFTSTKKRGSTATANAAEASVLACEQMMEQIAAIIDYDISDYLPPNSTTKSVSATQHATPTAFKPSSSSKAIGTHQKRGSGTVMTNNFMM